MSTDNQNTLLPSSASSSSDASVSQESYRPVHLIYDIPRGNSQLYSSGEEHKPGAYETTTRSPKGKKIPSRTVQAPAILDSINDSVSLDLDASTEIQYRGNERVIQVLRWLSSAMLAVNHHHTDTLINTIDPQDPDKKQKKIEYSEMTSPEIQAAVVGEWVLTGSNSNNDAHMIDNLLAFLRDQNTDKIDIHLGASPATPAAASVNDEERAGQTAQQRRHAGYLWDFVNNTDRFAVRLIAHARREAEAGAPGDGALVEQLLRNIHVVLQSGNNLEMAGYDSSKALVHAEQRIIEHIQRIQDTLHPQSLKHYPTAFAKSPLPVFLAGTKPPCAHCDTVEHTRHKQAQSQQNQSSGGSSTMTAGEESLFTIWRCEDPTTDPDKYSIGKFFGSAFLLPDAEIAYNIDYTILTQNGNSLPADFGHHVHGVGQPSGGYVAQPNTKRSVRLNSRKHGISPLTPSPAPYEGENPLKPDGDSDGSLDDSNSGRTDVKPDDALGHPVNSKAEIWQFNHDTPNKTSGVQQLADDVKRALLTAETPDADETRWIIQLQGDEITSRAVKALFLKHPGNSELILWNNEKKKQLSWDKQRKVQVNTFDVEIKKSLKWNFQDQALVQGPIAAPKGRLKILFVGHGVDKEYGTIIFAGRDEQVWENDFRKMLSNIPEGHASQIDVTLVGCRLVSESSSQSGLPQQLANLLLERGKALGINPAFLSLSARQYYIQVKSDGRKEAYIDGKWVSDASLNNEEYKHVWRYDSATDRMSTPPTLQQPFPVFYRSDNRSVEQISAAGGFKSWDSDFTLHHAREFIRLFTQNGVFSATDLADSTKYTTKGKRLLAQFTGHSPDLHALSGFIKYTVSRDTPWVCTAMNTATGGRSRGAQGGIYKISVMENLQAFRVDNNQLVRLTDAERITYRHPFLLMNADTLDKATMIALSHGPVGDKEITFFNSFSSDTISSFLLDSEVSNTLGDLQGMAGWRWKNETHQQTLAEEIKKKLATVDPLQDTSESQWIIQLHGDSTTSETTGDLLLKNTASSELILWDSQADSREMDSGLKWDTSAQKLVYSALLPPKDRLTILLVGHGADSSTDAAFGGRSPEAWKSDVDRMLARIPQGSVSQIDVILTGYRLVDATSSEGELPRQLAEWLLERGKNLGIKPESLSVSTQQHYIQAMPDGKKETYVPGEGWVNADTAAGGLHNLVWRYDNSTQKMLPEVSGSASRAPDLKKSVPDILHFIWLGKLDGVQQDYIKTWAAVNIDKKIKVWYDPDALLSYELGKRIKGHVLARAEHLIHTPGYINAVLQLQNEAHAFISSALSQGHTFDRAAVDFMQEKLGVPQADLARIRQENGDSYQNFIQQCDANQITLADVKTLSNGFNWKYYHQELALRQNLPAASDLIRLGALNQDGGIYFDADLLPRFQEEVFAGIQHPDFPTRNKSVPLQFAQTQLVMEYLHGQGYFHGRQVKVEAGQYSDHVTGYTRGNASGNAPGVEARTALVQALRDAIQRAGQVHLDSGSTVSLMSVFFSSLANISMHPDFMKVGGIMGGYSNAALASHPGSKTLDYAFKKINDNYAILANNDLMNINSTQELDQRINTAIIKKKEDILNNVKILSYRLDNLTDTRATIDLTGPNLIGHVVTQTFAEMAHSRKNEAQLSDEAEDVRSEVLFYDFNNATEEEAKSSWANNSSGRSWPFERLTLPENISAHLSELNETGKKLSSAADKALLIVAESFDAFQKAQGDKKITALVKLREDLLSAQGKYEQQSAFDLSDALKKTLRQIERGLFLDIPVKDIATFTHNVKKQPESEQKQALRAVIDVFSTFLSVSQEKGVAALLMMRKQLVSTLALLPVLENGKTTETALRETVFRMQEKIDRQLFSTDLQSGTDRTEMPAAVRGKIIDISGWSPEKAAWVHYHADAALHGAPGYNEQRASDLADREVASRQVFLTEMKDQISTFNIQVDKLYNGQVFFHELSAEEQQLISRFLDAGETAELIRRSEDGPILHQAAAILAEKSIDVVASMTDVRAALHAVFDAESAAWQQLAQEMGLAPDARADNEAGRIVLEGMRQHGGDVDSTGISADSYTTKAIGLRARVLNKLQTSLDRTGKVILAIGSLAALSRIQVINYRLTHEKLSDTKKAELNIEKVLALAELGADLSDEIVGLIQSKFSISITRPPAGHINVSTPLFRQSSLSVGTRMVQGIRTFGLEALGTVLSAAGTAFAWYGVHKAISELGELRKNQHDTSDLELKAELTAKITQLQVNLNVNIMTAIVSTILTAGSIVSLTAGIAAGFGLAGAAAVLAVSKILMAIAGPVGGAIMVAAFIGLWIYNGIKTVEEFAKYLDLSSHEKLALGWTSIFGAPPELLQVKYDLSKMQAALKEAMKQEALGVFDSYPSVKITHNYLIPNIQYNKDPNKPAPLDIRYISLADPLIQTGTTYAEVDIDMDAKKYERKLKNEKKSFDEKEHIYVRKTRDQVKATAIKQPLDIITREKFALEPKKDFLGTFGISLLDFNVPIVWIFKEGSGLFMLKKTMKVHNQIVSYQPGEEGQQAVLRVTAAGKTGDNNMYLYRHENNSAPIVALFDLDEKPDYRHLVISSENNRAQLIKLRDSNSTTIHAACSVRLDDDSVDDMLLVLSDRVLALSGGKQGFSLPETFSEDTAGLLVILHTDPAARIHVVRENEQITFFCVYQEEGQGKLDFFKFRKSDNGQYQLDARLPEALSLDMWAHKITVNKDDSFRSTDTDDSNSIFFQDLNGDSLADMVVIAKNGTLKVACQKRDGTFVPTENFSFFRAKTADGSLENLSFSEHKILGFCGTARTLYSRDNSGNQYAYTVVSRAENSAEVSWVNLNIPDKGVSRFVASVKPAAGDFIFLLGGGGIKQVNGGVNSDIFYLLDIKTAGIVDGGKGRDTLDFSRLNKTEVSSVSVNTPEAMEILKQWGISPSDKGVAAARGTDGSVQMIVFSNIENFTGTHGDDELTGDGNDNILDGVGGKDTLNAGAGNDVLKGVEGTFNGGLGIDYYQLRALAQTTITDELSLITIKEIDIIEDYSLGEDSYVMLDYRLDQIDGIAIEEGKHLLMSFFMGEVQYRFNNFYANTHAGAAKASSFEFTTKDGFRFRLKTAAAPPDGVIALSSIPVFFQGTLPEEERESVIVNLYAGDENTGAQVEIVETAAGQFVRRKVMLPEMFELELQHNGKQGMILGSERPEILTGSGDIVMKGYGGADTYLIKDAKKGIIKIHNEDSSSTPEQDSLILPWALPETRLSVEGSDVLLSPARNPDSHVTVRLCDFMTKEESRHLVVRDISGLEYRLRITQEGVAYLASGPLTLDKEDWLEVLSASPGRLTLDGRKRDLSAEKNKSTVIIDRSTRGNDLYGTEDVRNYLQVSGGDNHLYGGTLADVLQGGTGNDRMEGKDGNDIYYVQGSATIEDTGGEDILVLTEARNELLTLEKMEDNSLQIAYGRPLDRKKVVVKDFFSSAAHNKKIEHIVAQGALCIVNYARLVEGDMSYMASVISSMPSLTERKVGHNSAVLTDTVSQQNNLLTASAA